MKIQPIRRYRSPAFPTSAVLEQHPELLRIIPTRWRNHPLALQAMAATASLFLASCQTGSHPSKSTHHATIAPLFPHGDGRATFGCIVVLPPVCLSEEDARQVIVEEAQRHGIHFQEGGTVRLRTDTKDWPVLAKRYCDVPRTIDFPLDGRDPEKGISFECLSAFQDDSVMALYPELPRNFGCSVYEVNLPRDASVLKTKIAQSGITDTVALFYAPMKQYDSDEMKEEGVDEAVKFREQAATFLERKTPETQALLREELRLQVRDFIDWLKAQGIL